MATNNSILHLLVYNNYYNRIIRRENNINDYSEYETYTPLVCNFNPADGINTQHTINIPYLANTPVIDYVVVEDATTQEISSRWFIVNAERQRGGQYILTLHRDLIADFYDSVVNATTYIERAMVNIGNPLIYNPENLSFNEIKRNEYLLRDSTGCPWIVGYLAQNAFKDKDAITINTTDTGLDAPPLVNYTYQEAREFGERGLFVVNDITYRVEGYSAIAPFPQTVYGFEAGATQAYTTRKKTDSDNFNVFFPVSAIGSIVDGQDTLAKFQDAINNSPDILDAAHTYIAGTLSQKYFTKNDIQKLIDTNEMLVRDANGAKYIMRITAKEEVSQRLSVINSDLYTQIRTAALTAEMITGSVSAHTNLNGISITAKYQIYDVSVSPYSAKTITTTIKNTNRTLNDAPYRMFCIPFAIDGDPVLGRNGWAEINNRGGLSVFRSNPEAGYNMAIKMAADLGANIYDLQLLPYCPCRDVVQSKNGLALKPGLNLYDYLAIDSNNTITANETIVSPIINTDGNTLESFILWCSESSMTFAINMPITVPNSAVDFKIEHETSFYRLTSPNYNGSFQFKATANNGVDFIEVNATYKPYQPYIQLAPNFKGLYGGDYNDARGLVCGGSFSMPTLSDAWENYQIQNKSYMDAFNRQVENMEINYDIQRQQQKAAGVINTISASIGGAAAGGITGSAGGPWGAVAGAVVGGASSAIASGVGASADLLYADRLQREAMSYTKDQFNLSLANIKALPYSLSRVSSFDINNKYFPFLEFYSSTDEEKEILREKIAYNSMTVGAIGKINDYIQATPTFISGQIIRFVDFAEDYHAAAEIANEIHKGVYI